MTIAHRGADDLRAALILHLGQLQIGLINTGGKALVNQYVQIFKQHTDIGGKPALADRIGDGNTDNTGTITFNVTPGKYAVQVGDQVTYDISVEAGHITTTDGVKQEVQ